MTNFVQRKDGVVVGVFRVPQAGVAEEVLADDSPELVSFLSTDESPQRQIEALEVRHMLPRVVREYLLGDFAAKAAAAGKNPAALPAYVKLKALDDQIAALRAQRWS